MKKQKKKKTRAAGRKKQIIKAAEQDFGLLGSISLQDPLDVYAPPGGCGMGYTVCVSCSNSHVGFAAC